MSVEAHSAPTGSFACAEMNHYHFHMAVKLAKRVRWFQVRNYLDEKLGIKVNFTEMMNVRWQFFRLRNPIRKEGHQDLSTCGCCFATFIITNAGEEDLRE